jgi:OOP family OmpA-OmpF porin
VSAEGLAVLSDVAELLRRSPDSLVSIVGHTDGIGNEPSNLALSLDRAEAVRTVLVDTYGIASRRLSVEGVGESQPVAEEFDSKGADSPEGRQQNRRTEIRTEGFDGKPGPTIWAEGDR